MHSMSASACEAALRNPGDPSPDPAGSAANDCGFLETDSPETPAPERGDMSFSVRYNYSLINPLGVE